jgi:sugar lactone lactonase YvrE
LSDPNDVAVDAAGNLFIADFRNNWIRKVDANGILSNIAYCNYPSWVTLDASGGLFITSSSQVFEMDSNGTITALAGNLYLSGFSGDGGPAINASFNDPNGVAADANANLYIADTYNHRIRKVGLNGSPVLPLNGANTNNAGNYTLIINGSFGSITSSVVTLTVLIPPAITGIMPGTDGSVTLHFTGGANQNYLLQAATNLVAPVVWQTLSTNAADANGIWQFADTNTSAYPARFYRAAAP